MNQSTLNPTKRDNLFKVDPRNIIVKDGFNPRFDYGDVEQLKLSIIQNGLKMPLRGYVDPSNKEQFILTDGHRRMRAINKAIEEGNDIKYVLLVKEEKGYNEEQRTLDLIICNDGKKLDSLEEAEVVARLLKFEYKVSEIAEKTGRSLQHVYDMQKLANVEQRIKNLIKEGKVTSGAVIQLIKYNKDTENYYNALLEAIDSAETTAKEKVAKIKGKTEPKRVKDGDEEPYSAPEKKDEGEVEVVTPKVKATAKDIKALKSFSHIDVLASAIEIVKDSGKETFSSKIAKTLFEKLKSKASAQEIAEMLLK